MEPCAAGKLHDILGCRRERCSTHLHDVSPPALGALGFRAVLCDQAPAAGATSTEAKGEVWLYAQEGEGLRLVMLLTKIGGSAKYYKPEEFSIVGATRSHADHRDVDAITWRLRTPGVTRYGYGMASEATAYVTYCVSSGSCPLTLPLARESRFTPIPGSGPAPTYSTVHFAHHITKDGVDVRLLSATPRVQGDAGEQTPFPDLEGYIGHQPFGR
jgi:hypothetical protein